MEQTANTFTGGLIKDLNPIATPNDVLTDALNATLITFNGNETMLQNDMGNTNLTYYPRTWEAIESEDDTATDYREVVSKIREKVKLKDGYIPIGMKEHGDIIYIVSYNPEENKTEIGSFPGPEYRPIDKIPSKEINKDIVIKEDTLSKIYNLTEEGETLLKPYDLISDYSMEGLSPMFISTPTNKGLYIPKYINVNTNQDITDAVNITYTYNNKYNYKLTKSEFYSKPIYPVDKIEYTFQDVDYVLFSLNEELNNISQYKSLEILENKEYNQFISYPNIKKGDIGVSYILEDINGISYTNNFTNIEFNYNNYIPLVTDSVQYYDNIFIAPLDNVPQPLYGFNYFKNKELESYYLIKNTNSGELSKLEFEEDVNNLTSDYFLTITDGEKYIYSYYENYNNKINIKESELKSTTKYKAYLDSKEIEIIEKLITIQINGVDIQIPALLYREVKQ